MAATDDGKRKWTVMVFMGANSFEGNLPLDVAADHDLAEMRAIGSNEHLNIFVEKHDDKSVVREHVGVPDSNFNRAKSPRKGLDGKTLVDFVKQALTRAGHGYADHTMLVMWGHTYKFAFGRKRERDGTEDLLDFAELTNTLREFQQSMGGKKLDIIGFDSCEASTVEMACQLHPYANYLLSSEIGIPLPGWPYDRILDRIKDPQGLIMRPAEFGTYVVRRFCESYKAKDDAVSLTLLDLVHARDLAANVAWLAQRLAIALSDDGERSILLDSFGRAQTELGRPYVDVADLCVNLIRESRDAGVVAAARELGDFLVSPQGNVVGRSHEDVWRPLVVEHGRNAGVLARLNGISLYAPHLVPDKEMEVAERLYNNFNFTKMNLWRDLVHALARN